jgi:hypothetical protein
LASNRHLTWIHLAFLLAVTLMRFSTGLLAAFITYRLALVVSILIRSTKCASLQHSVTLLGKHNHLITGTRLCIRRFRVALVQVCLKLDI